MSNERFTQLLQKIVDLLNSENIGNFLVCLSVKDNDIIISDHFYKEMSYIEIDHILNNRRDKIKEEFDRPTTSLMPLKITNTKAEA